MQETYTEFTFDAAHVTTPDTPLHGHTFRARIYLRGPRHPEFGWSHDLLAVQRVVHGIKARLDHSLLNEIEGLESPTLENTTRWIFEAARTAIPGVDRVTLERGAAGHSEGCTCGESH
jgi:6-pyruvoyltetrahydropterin/6-carboxytetrahydropterin synthase